MALDPAVLKARIDLRICELKQRVGRAARRDNSNLPAQQIGR